MRTWSALVYTPRGLGTLWAPATGGDREALAALLGRRRAIVLSTLGTPAATSEAVVCRLVVHALVGVLGIGLVEVRRQVDDLHAEGADAELGAGADEDAAEGRLHLLEVLGGDVGHGERYTSNILYKSRLVDTVVGVSAEATFSALAEPRRRAMLLLVRDGPRSVNEIAEHFDITQQAVSQHLHVLKDAGLVAVRAEGRRRLYVVRPEGLESLEAFLAELWPAGLQRLKDAVESGDGG
jgi:DNA-binding transcriptional ArsR family regulator